MGSKEAVCRELCESGKFETGEGGCAPTCLNMLGSAREGPYGCSYRTQVHGELADRIMDALSCAGFKGEINA